MAVAIFCFLRNIERATHISGQLPHRKRAIGQRWVVSIGQGNYPVYVRAREHGYDIGYDSGLIVIRSSWKLGNPLFQGTVNGMPVSVKVRSMAEGHQLSYAGYDVRVVVRETNVAELAQYMPEPSDASGDSELLAPITGLITKLFVEEGQEVREGEALCIIEAMKMENILYADQDGVVETINVKAPGNVSADDVILTFVQS
jgi:propionyl-CoA carboxylase alpha chain